MLILTRRPRERIMIADDIVIEIAEIKGNMVRIGIAAPPNVKVWREEIYRRIQKEGGSVDDEIGRRLRAKAATGG